MNIKNKHVDAVEYVEKILGHVTFGEMLLAIRETDDMTQVEMAKKLGISKQELCDIEKDRKTISIERAIGFAKKLRYSEKVFIKHVIEDQLYRAGIKTQIEFTESFKKAGNE